MTVQLNWPPEVVDLLTEEARKRGLSLDAFLLETVLHRDSTGAASDEGESRRRREDAASRMLEIQQRVKPDPEGWTSRDYINYGRR